MADRLSHAVLCGSDALDVERADALGLLSGTLPDLRAETAELLGALQKGL